MKTSDDYEHFQNLPVMPDEVKGVVCHSEYKKSQFSVTMYEHKY